MARAEPIVKEVLLEATPEEVFAYLTESARYIQWMGVSAELDPRPGGVFRVDPNGRASDAISGRFVEVTPPSRIVFTWGYASPGHRWPPGSTTVEIDLIPQAGGGTLLRLVHRGFGGADQVGPRGRLAALLDPPGGQSSRTRSGPGRAGRPAHPPLAMMRAQRSGGPETRRCSAVGHPRVL